MPNFYQQRSANVWRTWFLVFFFLILVIAVGWAISWYFDQPALLYVAVGFAFFTNIFAYWNSDKVVLSLNHARLASREEFFNFYTVTENLAIADGLPMPKLYVIDDPAPNAFATGRNEKHAVVCATNGLLGMMSRTELEGVIAHELSHIKNRDILVMTMAVVLAGFIAIIADLFLRMSFHGGGNRREGNNALVLVIAVVGIILAPIAAQLIQLAISRKREFLADASGALLTRYPEGLASALRKIESYGAPLQHVSNATAHLFIGNPYGSDPEQGNWITRLFSTHPPVRDRIKALLGHE